jgi:two-component system chemotaxis response regulator CheY
MNVMIVEDNPKMREMIKRFIIQQVDNVDMIVESCDGAEAIEQYRQHQPDWVLMDVEMKPMDGITAVNAIRKMDGHAKIIMVTSHGDTAIRTAAHKAGALAFVLKEDLQQIPPIIAGAKRKRTFRVKKSNRPERLFYMPQQKLRHDALTHSFSHTSFQKAV